MPQDLPLLGVPAKALAADTGTMNGKHGIATSSMCETSLAPRILERASGQANQESYFGIPITAPMGCPNNP